MTDDNIIKTIQQFIALNYDDLEAYQFAVDDVWNIVVYTNRDKAFFVEIHTLNNYHNKDYSSEFTSYAVPDGSWKYAVAGLYDLLGARKIYMEDFIIMLNRYIIDRL